MFSEEAFAIMKILQIRRIMVLDTLAVNSV